MIVPRVRSANAEAAGGDRDVVAHVRSSEISDSLIERHLIGAEDPAEGSACEFGKGGGVVNFVQSIHSGDGKSRGSNIRTQASGLSGDDVVLRVRSGDSKTTGSDRDAVTTFAVAKFPVP